MRIALVCPYDVAVPGGVQAQVLGLGRALAAAGHGVVVVAPGPKGAAQLGGLDVVGVGRSFTVRANGSLAPVAPTPAAMLRTRRALRDAAADVVHVHEPLVPGPALAAATTSGAPVVGSFHRARASRTYVAYGHALRRVVRGLDDRVAVSTVARATLWAAAGPCECAILANAIDLERFAGAAPVAAEAPTVLFVGRLEPRKGLAVLLEAYGGLAGDSRLRIIGDGPEAATPPAPLRARSADLVARAGLRPGARPRALRRPDPGRTVVGRRVLRRRAPRGDGGGYRGRRLGHPRLPARRRRSGGPRPAG